MKSEKGIAREKRKNGENVPHHYIHSKETAELVANSSDREGMIADLKLTVSRRTFRRVMSYVRANDRARERLEELKP